MRHLVIGGDGFIGSAVRQELAGRGATLAWTSRRHAASAPPRWRFDLRDDPAVLPDADLVYLVAAVPTFLACETDRESWRVNVDGTIAVAQRFPDAFLVFVSSDSVEWCGSAALARQKSQVEGYLRHRRAAILRPTRVNRSGVLLFAQFAVDLALVARAGVHSWSEPDVADLVRVAV